MGLRLLGSRFTGLSGVSTLSSRIRILLAASVLLLVCLLKPHMQLPRPVYDWFIVLDITQSMNVRDYSADGQASSRMSFAKQAIREALRNLPCGSRVALGLFTERNSMNTMRPLEVCAHFGALDEAVASVDWRMAWAADSFIAHGLFDAISQAPKLGSHMRVAFISDGQQAPPANARYMPSFDGKPGAVSGLVLGAGGASLQPIPKLDEHDNVEGYWELDDVQRYATFGMSETLSVQDMEKAQAQAAQPLEGQHGRNAPFGAHPGQIANANMSALDEVNLQRLAHTTGLTYQRLAQVHSLAQLLSDTLHAVWRRADTDLRPPLAVVAMLLLVFYFIPPSWLSRWLTRWRASYRRMTLQLRFLLTRFPINRKGLST